MEVSERSDTARQPTECERRFLRAGREWQAEVSSGDRDGDVVRAVPRFPVCVEQVGKGGENLVMRIDPFRALDRFLDPDTRPFVPAAPGWPTHVAIGSTIADDSSWPGPP